MSRSKRKDKKHNRKEQRSQNLRSQFAVFRDNTYKIPQEELLKAFINTGVRHEKDFDELLKKAKELISKFNPAHILAVLWYYGLSTGMTEAGKIKKKRTNSLEQPHIELAQALALAILPEHVASNQVATPNDVQEIWDTLIAVEDSFHLKRLKKVDLSSDRQQKVMLYLQEHVRLNTQFVRNWGCFKYFREMLVNLYEPLDPLYKNVIGINATDLIKIFDYLVSRGDRIINKHWSCFRPVATAKSLKDAVKIYCETHPHPNESPSHILEKLTTMKASLEEAKFILYPYPLSRQKAGLFKMDSPPVVTAVGTEGARRATGVPTATPYTSAGVR
jgi:hypothetical protein